MRVQFHPPFRAGPEQKKPGRLAVNSDQKRPVFWERQEGFNPLPSPKFIELARVPAFVDKDGMKSAFFILPLCLAVGCSTGSSLVSDKRPAVPATSVAVFYESPTNAFTRLGVVSATAMSKGYLIPELKRRAGKIGADGIIVQNVSGSPWDWDGVHATADAIVLK
jgi:hypothetical protein